MDPDAPVHYAYPSRDHSRTELAVEVRKVEEGLVKFNGYHELDELTDVEYEMELDDGKREVVILDS